MKIYLKIFPHHSYKLINFNKNNKCIFLKIKNYQLEIFGTKLSQLLSPVTKLFNILINELFERLEASSNKLTKES